MRVVPSSVGAELRQYENEVLEGATISEEELVKRFPQYKFEDPTLTVSSEIDLLRAAKTRGVSPYFAYRMGLLSQFVATLNQPFFAVPGSPQKPKLRERYDADAEASHTEIPYVASKRRYVVDARAYFDQRRSYLKDAENLISSDYSSGVGFSGYAKRSLNVYFTNAVDSVADMLCTVFGQEQLAARPLIQPLSFRDYYVDSLGFYLRRNDDARAASAYASLENEGLLDPETVKKLGDAYYDAGRYDRAVSLYRDVLAKAPRRADVRQRISDYFFTSGLALLEKKQYEEAVRAFDEVLKNDMSRADAREKKLEAGQLLSEQAERLESTRKMVADAKQATESAARAEAQRKFADAVALYRQARNTYAKVSEEFEGEHAEAARASKQIEIKIARLMDELVNEVRDLRSVAVKDQARELMQNSSKQQLRALATRVAQDQHVDAAKLLRSQLVDEERRALQR
jgi:tetratricopeptide (TPR) repeat protein